MTATKGAAKPPIVNQVSAGGVVYNRLPNDVVVAIVSVGDDARWQLPKGLLEKGESPESAAVRETREEAGIQGEVETLLDTIEYWYVGMHEGRKVRFHKLAHFFLLKYRGGEVSEHDHEVNESRWVPIDEAAGMLAFKSERNVLARANELLKDDE
jgi:8-oxo-dGTP pyrophosphatase MutT (NUDIX family)